MARGVLDRDGRPIRPLVWFYHAPEMCHASLAKGDWSTGRTQCKRIAAVVLDDRPGRRRHICPHHAGMAGRGRYVYVDDFGTVRPEHVPERYRNS